MLDEKADRPTRTRRRQQTKSSRNRGEARGHKIKNRGMYESSSDGGEDADVETSRSPAASRRRGPNGKVIQQQPNQRRGNSVSGTPDNSMQRIMSSGGRRPLSGGSDKRETPTTGSYLKLIIPLNIEQSILIVLV